MPENPFANLCVPEQSRLGSWTFAQWRDRGYTVMRGEQATGRNGDGAPTFTEDQVTEWQTNNGDYTDGFLGEGYDESGIPF